jgi:hypothetical protein
MGVSETGRRFFPRMVIHDTETDEFEAALRGEFQIFSLFRHPEYYPGGLPIFGFKAGPNSPTILLEAALLLDANAIKPWLSQIEPLVGHRSQRFLSTLAKSGEEPEAYGEVQFVLHNIVEDKVKVIRKVYLQPDMQALIHEYWRADINFHRVSMPKYLELDRFSLRELVNMSRTWFFSGDRGFVEITGTKF